MQLRNLYNLSNITKHEMKVSREIKSRKKSSSIVFTLPQFRKRSTRYVLINFMHDSSRSFDFS